MASELLSPAHGEVSKDAIAGANQAQQRLKDEDVDAHTVSSCGGSSGPLSGVDVAVDSEDEYVDAVEADDRYLALGLALAKPPGTGNSVFLDAVEATPEQVAAASATNSSRGSQCSLDEVNGVDSEDNNTEQHDPESVDGSSRQPQQYPDDLHPDHNSPNACTIDITSATSIRENESATIEDAAVNVVPVNWPVVKNVAPKEPAVVEEAAVEEPATEEAEVEPEEKAAVEEAAVEEPAVVEEAAVEEPATEEAEVEPEEKAAGEEAAVEEPAVVEEAEVEPEEKAAGEEPATEEAEVEPEEKAAGEQAAVEDVVLEDVEVEDEDVDVPTFGDGEASRLSQLVNEASVSVEAALQAELTETAMLTEEAAKQKTRSRESLSDESVVVPTADFTGRASAAVVTDEAVATAEDTPAEDNTDSFVEVPTPEQRRSTLPSLTPPPALVLPPTVDAHPETLARWQYDIFGFTIERGVVWYHIHPIDGRTGLRAAPLLKRFSDFRVLELQLRGAASPLVADMPELPKPGMGTFLRGRKSKRTIEVREKAFKALLRYVARYPELHGSAIFQRFLETSVE